MDIPETRYAKTPDGLSIAYQVFGDGPRDLVVIPPLACLDVMWEEPSFAAALRRLATFSRVISLDWRGFGASDPIPLGALPTPETWMEDVRVVLDDVGSERTSIFANGAPGYMAMLFAATYPQRTDALVLMYCYARVLEAPDYQTGITEEMLEVSMRAAVDEGWGTGQVALSGSPSRARDDRFRQWGARWERMSISRAGAGAMMRWVRRLDMRDVLPVISTPTLILDRNEQKTDFDPVVYLAEHIQGARLVAVPGTDTVFFTERADEVIDQIEEFITGTRPQRGPDRALATVLFTDIVSSTERASAMGDKGWLGLLSEHDSAVARALDQHRGRKIKSTGDGALCLFDGPARAVRCAQEIVDGVRPLGIEIRAGLHTGEVELRGEDIGGIAVHIGQRVSALAGPGEVFVSRTVTDLVAGSGLEFEERGEHELKGVPGRWAIYAVRSRN